MPAGEAGHVHGGGSSLQALQIRGKLLFDSRVVYVLRSSILIVDPLASLQPFFFNGLRKAGHFLDNVGA
jgi:hypothetical protein